MKISFNWIKNYVDINISPEELATKLTLVGLEVENIEYLGGKYKNFVIGKVIKINKHPNADKLTVCDISIGREEIKVVCGAPNVSAEQKVVIGLSGAVVPRNQHDPEGNPFTLSKTSIRGVVSNGMICSEYELGLGDDKDGILVMPEATKEGITLADYLGLNDVVFEVGVTPNRPDCLSHLGIAREIASVLGKKLKLPQINLKESKDVISKSAKVIIRDKENCPRYTARVIMGIKVSHSPEWLQKYLSAVGIRPINNIVDITNFVLMETGHPLHAFDYDKLTGHTIIVRRALNGEHFITLDGKGRELKSGMLLICDAEKPIALAGVMGGLNSEISNSTVNLLIESAYFNPQSIRKTSKLLGLSSNASQRFERGADPNNTGDALNRAVQLISEISGGKVLKRQIDVYPKKIKSVNIGVNLTTVNNLLGTSLTSSKVVKLLSKIDLKAKNYKKKKAKSEEIIIEVPTFRPDIEREIDVIEEVARLFGYDNIETKNKSLIQFSTESQKIEIKDSISNFLVGKGFSEIVTNSLQKMEFVSSLWLPEGRTVDDVVKIQNPISRDMAALRTSLIPSMLEVIRHNIYQQQKNLNLFEFGNVYIRNGTINNEDFVPGYFEKEILIIGKTGLSEHPYWTKKDQKSDIFDIKGIVEDIFSKILLDKYKFIPYPVSKALLDEALNIEIDNIVLGCIGKVHKEILKTFDIEQDVIIAELDTMELSKFISNKTKYQPLPVFPMMARDLAFMVDNNIPVSELTDVIKSVGGKLLKSVELFDQYSGDQVEKIKKSCAFTLQFLSEERTLTENEIEQATNRIVHELNQKFNAVLRSKN
jgi:phenylalanyl-tRNA synthetase beta chain